ncbi:hypothetical protein [Flavobacterium sp. ACN6]|nr:hypothetical protein [Flavobacterium sp. ACN6]PBJ08057.1 hypothetical protein BSF42_37740 [Flavobacterium sp. ACN6]
MKYKTVIEMENLLHTLEKKNSGREINGKTYDDMPDFEGVLADTGY